MTNLRRFCIASVIGSVALVSACSDDSTGPVDPPTPDTRTLTEIRDVDYIHHRFFYFDDPAMFIGPNAATVKVFRTVTPTDVQNNPSIAYISGWAAADAEGWGHGTVEGIVLPLNAGELPTAALEQNFEMLQLDVDYTFIRSPANNAVIGIALAQAIPDDEQRALAVSYITVDGWAIGGTYQQMGVLPTAPGYSADKLVLELIKEPVSDPNSAFPSVWKLEMRNVYDLGKTNIHGASMEVDIEDVLVPRSDHTIPNGSTVPYLQIFGLDQEGGFGSTPDGRIDVTPARVDLEHGLLFFPLARAFHPDPSYVDEWTDGAFAFAGSYQAQYDNSLAIYTEKLTAPREGEVHQYIIKVLSKQE